MELQLSFYVVPLALAGSISALLALFVYVNRHKRTAPQLVGILTAAFVWSAADAFRILSVDPSAKLFWHQVRFLGSTLVVFAVFFHALEYTNREEWITRRSIAGVSAVFVVTNVLAWTGGLLGHGLIHAEYGLVTSGSLRLLEFEYGPWFYVNAVYSYLLLVATAAMYLLDFVRRTGTYRLQAGGLLLGTLVPWAMNGVYLAGYSVVDLTAFGFMVTGTVFAAQFYRFQLLDVVPIARSTVVNHLENGYLVLDTGGRVIDVNDAGAALFEHSREEIIGADAGDLLADYPDVTEAFRGESDVREEVTIESDGERRDYDVEMSSVYDDHDRHVGRVVLIRDVTEQRRRQRELKARSEALERHNEKLDQFASVVSHDLRNPIAVAKGHLQLGREDGDEHSFERVEEALDRLEDITGDVLALARQEREPAETEPVELASLSEAAWKTVDTGGASLELETARTVAADPERLRRALENLVRNSVEYGPDDVTVRVGDLEGGFYVADDGPGIPEDVHTDVFDPGFTTGGRGTGFGLSIVRATADAHGWTVQVTTGAEGGARFEFTEVTVVDDVAAVDEARS